MARRKTRKELLKEVREGPIHRGCTSEHLLAFLNEHKGKLKKTHHKMSGGVACNCWHLAKDPDVLVAQCHWVDADGSQKHFSIVDPLPAID